jgi:uncharacterized MAPEG superfamily protein
MPIPLWILLGFAFWTLTLLVFGIGASRWSQILTRRAQLVDFPADAPHGSPRYRRIVRAHANCVENLPVYGALALSAWAAEVDSSFLDGLAVTLLAARVAQSAVHIALEQTNPIIAVRFSLFAIQLFCMVAMGAIVAIAAA